MSQILPEYISYWTEVGPLKFIRVFWAFFFFEFIRYYLLDYFVLFLYLVTSRKRKRKRIFARSKLLTDNPLVSIIIPGKNEGQHFFKLLKSLEEQTYKNYEIIVIDDGSDDMTGLIGRDFEKQGLIDIFFSNKVRGGKASAANLALRLSKGKYIIHLDADCSFDRDAIENILIPFYSNPKIGAVGGNIKARNYKDNLCCKIQAIEYLKTISLGRIITSYLGVYEIISGAFGAFKREAIDGVGGWDVGPGLDGDITLKIRKSGYKVVFEPSSICMTNVPSSFRILTKQRLRWNKSVIRFRLRKHNDIFLPDSNFSWLNFFAVSENLFYNIVLDIVWWIYVFDMGLNYIGLLQFILPMNLTLYAVMGYVKMFSVYLFSERKKEELFLWPYVFLAPLYTGFYLRTVRTIAYISEFFFKQSYKDSWNPYKSSSQAKKERS